MELPHDFGGQWTETKLAALQEYLKTYLRVLSKQIWCTRVYIDAFAGTGYRERKNKEKSGNLFSRGEDPPQQFYNGSATIALEINEKRNKGRPLSFDKFIFIESDPKRFAELANLQDQFPHRKDDIDFFQEDANTFLERYCLQADWLRQRAVLFLDPYGLEVKWNTLKAIAATKAIDMWLLFPSGQAVTRLLRNDGEIPDGNARRLTELFGTDEWKQRFYVPAEKPSKSLFDGPEPKTIKKRATTTDIVDYYNERLRTIFPAVVDGPIVLNNSRTTIFHLCFACSNPEPKAHEKAIKIAKHLCDKWNAGK